MAKVREFGTPRKRGAFVFGLIAGGLIFGFGGWFLKSYISPPQSYRGVLVRQSSASYTFINPLLACEIGSEETFPELAPLKAKFTGVIRQDVRNGRAESVSVYFRTLNSARWIDVNGDTGYTPASLFKVFVMMAFLKDADDANDPGILNRELVFQGTSTSTTDISGKEIRHFVHGNYYTIQQLIDQMIIYSDNDAALTLVNNFDKRTWNAFNLLFTDLQIPSPATQKENSLLPMSVDQYAMIFRVLYGATYLSRQYSEQALNLLSRTSYAEGLAAGVPGTITVAHKYGDAIDPAPQLHDCGIVYYPKHPYLLCIMTRGSDFTSLRSVIEDISKAAYQEANALYTTM